MNKNEMLAEILAEMCCGTIPKHQTDHELLVWYAARIKAAVDRHAAIAYLHGQMDEITDVVTKLETWCGSLRFRLERLRDEMRNRSK